VIGTAQESIVSELSRLLDDGEAYEAMARAINPYGDGLAAERIVSAILGENFTPFIDTLIEFDPASLKDAGMVRTA